MPPTEERKLPWRLGKYQRRVVEYLIDLNHSLVSSATQWREKPIDFAKGGGSVWTSNLYSLCRFDTLSEAERLLRGLADRGILTKAATHSGYTLSQSALKATGFIK